MWILNLLRLMPSWLTSLHNGPNLDARHERCSGAKPGNGHQNFTLRASLTARMCMRGLCESPGDRFEASWSCCRSFELEEVLDAALFGEEICDWDRVFKSWTGRCSWTPFPRAVADVSERNEVGAAGDNSSGSIPYQQGRHDSSHRVCIVNLRY